MSDLFKNLEEEVRFPAFLEKRNTAKSGLYRQIMATTKWRRPDWSARPLDLCGDAEICLNGAVQSAAVRLSVGLIGGHNGYHAYLYLGDKFLLESSRRNDAIGKAESAGLEEAARDLHQQAQSLLGVDLEELFQSHYPISMYKKESRRTFWIALFGVLAVFALVLTLFLKGAHGT